MRPNWRCASLAQFEPWLERVMHFPEEVVACDAASACWIWIRDVQRDKASPFPKWE